MKVLLIIVGVLAFFGMMAYMTMGLRQVRVEVCMSFQGRDRCAIAGGATRDQTLRTATENACAVIASGMTESMQCAATPPKSVRWLTQ